MPHFIIEYTDNIKSEARIPQLLENATRVLAAEGYPVAGMRARAIELKDYFLVDGQKDYAMAHAALKIMPGHTLEEKKRACSVLFAMMKEHFVDIFASRYFLMSLELVEVVSADGPTLKLSNLDAVLTASHAQESLAKSSNDSQLRSGISLREPESDQN